MLSFGVTVLPDPPYARFLELIELAEEQGFEYGWTYDSHVLWQESTPLLTMAVERTKRMKFGHFVTNPGTREPTVLASMYATLHDISDGRMVMGIGRGDSARRYIGQQPVKVAEFERRCAMIRDFMNGREVSWNEKELQLKWVREALPDIPLWVAGYGPKALAVAGRVADGVIIQLADPDIIQWIMGTARKAAEEVGRDPSELKCIVGAPSHVSDDIAEAREQTKWFPAMVSNHVQDLHRPLRRRRLGRAAGAHRLRPPAQVLRLRRALARRREARRLRPGRDRRPLLGARERAADHGEAEGARVDRRRPVQHLPHDRAAGGDAARVRAAT